MKKANLIEIIFINPIPFKANQWRFGISGHSIEIPDNIDSNNLSINSIHFEPQFNEHSLFFKLTSQYIQIQPDWYFSNYRNPSKKNFIFPFHNILKLEIEEKPK